MRAPRATCRACRGVCLSWGVVVPASSAFIKLLSKLYRDGPSGAEKLSALKDCQCPRRQ
jgi:hypothetical protein